MTSYDNHLTTACFPPVENFFFDIILTANLSQDPLENASRTSPHAPLKNIEKFTYSKGDGNPDDYSIYMKYLNKP